MRQIPFHSELLEKIINCPTRSLIVLKDPSIVNLYNELDNSKIIRPGLDSLDVTEDEIHDFDYIVIENAEQIVNQPILYTVLDQIQYSNCKIILSTCKTDLLDLFEKRIKSRFNNCVINLFEFYMSKSGCEIVTEILKNMDADNDSLERFEENRSKINEYWETCQNIGLLFPISNAIICNDNLDPLFPNRLDILKLTDMEKNILVVCIEQNQIHPYITCELIKKYIEKKYRFSSLVLQQKMDRLCELGFIVPCELNWRAAGIPRKYQPFQCIADNYDLATLQNQKLEIHGDFDNSYFSFEREE
eukprot:NODE_91_length_21557_cov_0.766660.p10 type:complete len:303 gc:universal NODE_91_length_21557_cov_0.766660:1789-2697(+)